MNVLHPFESRARKPRPQLTQHDYERNGYYYTAWTDQSGKVVSTTAYGVKRSFLYGAKR